MQNEKDYMVLPDNAASSFIWGSSSVDWCEGNFEITEFIAEFWNTMSNVLFFVLPPLLMYLFGAYGRRVTRGVHLVWFLLLVVGAGSVCFHATLSLFGQLWDEMAIIWVVMTALAVWFPDHHLPYLWQRNRHYFSACMLAVTALITGLACIMPALNCMFLFLLVVPVIVLMFVELRKCQDLRVFHLGMRVTYIFAASMVSWLVDKFLCDTMSRLGFPYLHCAWHVGILLSSYQVCVLFAYFAALARVPELLPVMRLWPEDNYVYCGVPYVTFKTLPTEVVDSRKDI